MRRMPSMQTVTLSDKTISQLRQAAALRGLETDAYAEELLGISLAVVKEYLVAVPDKTHHAMEFSGIAPTRRAASEIDADIEAGRAGWDRDFTEAFPGKAMH